MGHAYIQNREMVQRYLEKKWRSSIITFFSWPIGRVGRRFENSDTTLFSQLKGRTLLVP